MASRTPRPLEYSIVNAFTTSALGGNPAVVVHLPTNPSTQRLSNITKVFNQPIASFVFPSSGKTSLFGASSTRTFGLRWFTTTKEVQLCGHGTVAAAHALFLDTDRVPPNVKLLQFETLHGIVTARKVAGGKIQLEMPVATVTRLDKDEAQRITRVLARAFKKDDLAIKFIGSGGQKLKHYLLIELDASENIKSANVDTELMTGTAPYAINIITTTASEAGIDYETRMFAPLVGIQEDQACGSANCVLAPYWSKKLGIKSGAEMCVKQVSARGANLWASVDEGRQMVRVSGEATLVAKGNLVLDLSKFD
ncbi:Diaminopimelate epimerase-like protein [Rickenella mellea]|uniref:Diaminopimelate epimerase-like protein n=1 Tax=Rickenella mellea TaxID=50990 RepID=A0A4Y7QKU8_9AGAM|nr:Diaminopimelate epimerase-like protein [Rickenella mellea]